MITTYRLGSSEAVYAPGIVDWAMQHYWHEPDRPQLRTVIAKTWNIPDAVAGALLDKTVPFTIDGETVVFDVDASALTQVDAL
ncbi:hypothetical protein [Rhizobium ruizarguesonis]